MTQAIIPLILFSPLIWIPGLVNLFTLPKLAYLSILMVLAIYYLRAMEYPRWPYRGWAGLYVACLLLSLKNAVNPVAWIDQISLDVMGLLAFYFVVNFVEREKIEEYLEVFLYVSLFMSLTAFTGLTGWIGGTEGNPSLAGAILGMAFFIGARMMFLYWKDLKLLIAAYSTILVAIIYHIYLTSSLATFLGICAGVTVYGVYGLSRMLRSFLAVCLAGTLLTVGLWAIYPLLPVHSSIRVRAEVLESSFGMITDFPLFGVGRGNAVLMFPLYAEGDYGYTATALHNDFLQMWAEAGPLALFSLLMIVALVLGQAWPALMQGNQTALLLTAMLASMGSHFLFNFPMQIPELQMLFWVFLGMLWREGHD